MAPKVVDNQARLDIAVLTEKVENLSDGLDRHMQVEEKQRQELKEDISDINTRVSALSKLLWLSIGVAGGPQMLDMASNLPLF